MTLRQKVTNAMECCLHMLTDSGESHCKDCPYNDLIMNHGCDNPVYCIRDYVRDGLKIIKPKVYSIADFYGEDFGYLEYREKREGWSCFDLSPVSIGDVDEYTVTLVHRSAAYDAFDWEDMNKIWRVWSGYPSHEEILEAKWDV